jgi:hypothetical protein
MVTIKYLTHEGDTPQTLQLEEAKEKVVEELDKGNLVFDQDEKRIITKATMGQIRDDSSVVVFPRIAGG